MRLDYYFSIMVIIVLALAVAGVNITKRRNGSKLHKSRTFMTVSALITAGVYLSFGISVEVPTMLSAYLGRLCICLLLSSCLIYSIVDIDP